jgi:hypothetical protein
MDAKKIGLVGVAALTLGAGVAGGAAIAKAATTKGAPRRRTANRASARATGRAPGRALGLAERGREPTGQLVGVPATYFPRAVGCPP